MTETLNDRFEVIRTLGEGGQGRAFLARDGQTGGQVVVKELHMGRAADWKAIELFERETEILRNLAHPAIPGYVDGFHLDDGGRVCLVQEYIEGENLEVLAEAGELFDEAGVREFLAQMLDILGYLHSFSPPVVHRDIKPSNIIRDARGKYHLVDFGAVQLIVQDDVGGSTIVGTSGFMPPEQLVGRAQPASDIYSLAASCVQMACGIEPGDIPMKRMKLQFRDLVGLSEALSDVLDTMLEPQVQARFTDARAVQEALKTGVIAVKSAPTARPAPAALSGATSTGPITGLASVRQKIADSSVLQPVSDARLDEYGTLHIETHKNYGVPIISMASANLVGGLMVYSGFNGGPPEACCTGFPLIFGSIGFLFYRVIKRFRQYVERLRISENGVELESGYRNGALGPLVVTKQVQIPLYELRNCYLHIYNPTSSAKESKWARVQNRKASGVRFTDARGRDHAFGLDAVLTRGKSWLSVEERKDVQAEVAWLFELIQAHLTALTDGDEMVLDSGADAGSQDAVEAVEAAQTTDEQAW